MEHGTRAEPQAVTHPKESDIEPGCVDCEAGAGDEAEDIGDAERKNLLSEKDQYSQDDFPEPPYSCSVDTSNGVSLDRTSPTGDTSVPEIRSFEIPFTVPLPRQSQCTCTARGETIQADRYASTRNHDLERNQTEVAQERAQIGRAVALERRTNSAPLFGTGLSFSEHLDDTRKRIIENIWKDVIPWELTMFVPQDDEIVNPIRPWNLSMLDREYDEMADPIDLVGRCRNTLELWKIFALPTEKINNPNNRAKLDASILTWHINKGRQGMPEGRAESDIMFGIIICCCLAARRSNITIGNILKHCYRVGVLDRKKRTKSEDYMKDILKVIECTLAMNRILQLEPLLIYEDQGWKTDRCGLRRVEELLATKRSLEEILGINPVDLLQILHILNHKQNLLEIASGSSFRVDDLNVKSLRSVGRLCIRWTTIIENHLLLNLENMTLSIARRPLPREKSLVGGWQSMFLNRLPPTFLDRPNSTGDDHFSLDENSLNQELERTWAFLCATSKNPKRRRSFYRRLPRPPWADDGTPEWIEHQQTGQPERSTQSPHDRIMNVALIRGFLSYSEFPVFETRLRQLRYYMDNQRPTGLRQLWIDKRDSLNYYTFWTVISFGVIGILLALVSLAVNIAQAVASFRALALAVPPAPST